MLKIPLSPEKCEREGHREAHAPDQFHFELYLFAARGTYLTHVELHVIIFLILSIQPW